MAIFTVGANITSTAQVADGSIATADLADGAVTLAKEAAGTQGGLRIFGAAGAPTELAAGTSGYFLKTLGAGSNAAWASIGGAGATSLIPAPDFFVFRTKMSPAGLSGTWVRLVRVVVPVNITVTQVSVNCESVTTAGLWNIACFSEDGQTRLFSVQSASISTAGVKSVAVSNVLLAAGVYYLAFQGVVLADSQFTAYDTTDASGTDLLATLDNAVTGKSRRAGYIATTDGVMPATIDPTAMTSFSLISLVFRLD